MHLYSCPNHLFAKGIGWMIDESHGSSTNTISPDGGTSSLFQFVVELFSADIRRLIRATSVFSVSPWCAVAVHRYLRSRCAGACGRKGMARPIATIAER